MTTKDLDGEDDGEELTGDFVAETADAELWSLEEYGGKEIWIPKSQIIESDQSCEVTVTSWYGRKLEEEHG